MSTGAQLVARVRLLLSGAARLGYVGAPAAASNLGDALMRRAAARVLAPFGLADVVHARSERRLRRARLGGPEFFRGVAVGGGTLLHPATAPLVEELLAQGVPLFTLGTGAGSWGYGMTDATPLEVWRGLLGGFTRIGVRGPRSRAALEAVGCRGVEVVGDLALVETPRELPLEAPGRRLFGLNVLPPEDGAPSARDLRAALAPLVRALVDRGWTPVPFAMDAPDAAATASTLSLAGGPTPPVARPRSLRALQALLAPCDFSVACRLHAAVFSTTVGVTPLSLGYRQKCADFMESMGLERWLLDASQPLGPEQLVPLGLELAEEAAGARRDVHRRALDYRARLERYAAEVLATLVRPA